MATGTSLSAYFPWAAASTSAAASRSAAATRSSWRASSGRPAYVVAEDDLRARARAFLQAGRDAGHDDFHVVFASKAFPCTAVLALFAQEGLWCDVGLRRRAAPRAARGLSPRADRPARQRQVRGRAAHGAAAPRRGDRDRQLRRDRAAEAARGRGRARATAPRASRCSCASRPDVSGRDAREDLDRPGRLEVRLRGGRRRRGDRARAGRSQGCRCAGCTRTSARSCSSSSRFAARSRELAAAGRASRCRTSAAASASQYTEAQPAPPSIEDYVGDARGGRARARDRRRAGAC